MKIIFVGSVNIGGIADDGETMKNRMLIDALSKKTAHNISVIDTRNRPKRILYMLKYIISLLIFRNSKIVFSASSFVTYKLVKIAHLFKYNPQSIYYWVIGGKYADYVKQGRINKTYYLNMKYIFVEGSSMKQDLESLGYANVRTFPNFKNIPYIPQRQKRENNILRFVFLSRIIPQKGVDLIIEATKLLNNNSQNDFIVDFYGKIDSNYEMEFQNKISLIPNLNYRGFLNLTDNSGYDTLASYDAMLFPTFWEGEGFPGIIIDAYIAGLPIIASDWNLNSQIVKNGVTGFIIPTNDIQALSNMMRKFITGEIDISKLSITVQHEANNYNINNVINKNVLTDIGLI